MFQQITVELFQGWSKPLDERAQVDNASDAGKPKRLAFQNCQSPSFLKNKSATYIGKPSPKKVSFFFQ